MIDRNGKDLNVGDLGYVDTGEYIHVSGFCVVDGEQMVEGESFTCPIPLSEVEFIAHSWEEYVERRRRETR